MKRMKTKAQSAPRARPLPYLRKARERRGISARELSRRTGVGRASLTDLEHLRRGAYGTTIRKLAEALDCEPWQLTGINPWEPSEQELVAMRQLLKTGKPQSFFIEEQEADTNR